MNEILPQSKTEIGSWGWTSSDRWNWLKKKIVMKMDETYQGNWNCEMKGHKLKVNDINEGYHMDVVVHIMCQNWTKLCFYPSNHTDTNFTMHMYTPIVHALALRLGQKWQKNIFRPKKHFSWPMKWGNMHPVTLVFFWGEGDGVGFLLFPMCSHQVLNMFLKFATCFSTCSQ
jgi:hypothetical protein